MAIILCRWRTAFFVVACPAIALAHVSAFVLPDANEMDPPPFVQYDHLRIRCVTRDKRDTLKVTHVFPRTKKFPWGDGNHSLIHNPHTNALPDGFEHGEH